MFTKFSTRLHHACILNLDLVDRSTPAIIQYPRIHRVDVFTKFSTMYVPDPLASRIEGFESKANVLELSTTTAVVSGYVLNLVPVMYCSVHCRTRVRVPCSTRGRMNV